MRQACGVDVNQADDTGATALMVASCNGHVAVVKLLCSTPAIDVNARDQDGKTPLTWAVHQDKTDVVGQLLNVPGIEVNHVTANRGGCTLLMYASETGATDVVRLLLKAPGIEVNQAGTTGSTALMLACCGAQTEDRTVIVQLLLDASAAVNAADHRGYTALIFAAENGHIESVRTLLAHPDVDVSATNADGDSALMRAAGKGQTAVVDLLKGFQPP